MSALANRVAALEAIPAPTDLARSIVDALQDMAVADGIEPMTPDECERQRVLYVDLFRRQREAA